MLTLKQLAAIEVVLETYFDSPAGQASTTHTDEKFIEMLTPDGDDVRNHQYAIITTAQEHRSYMRYRFQLSADDSTVLSMVAFGTNDECPRCDQNTQDLDIAWPA